jgi:hypothetical protein
MRRKKMPATRPGEIKFDQEEGALTLPQGRSYIYVSSALPGHTGGERCDSRTLGVLIMRGAI